MIRRDPIQRANDLQVRLKLFVTNVTTYGYAIMGASFVDPFIKVAGFKTASYVGLALGLVLHVVAWYVAPYGEKA
uniref:Uncharacterized protein n=1 Tax=Caulobacter sp. (strain K31) TaxID=366602 RepID=B0T2G1_CAUSK